MHGITMGGGVGASVYAHYRIVCEHTVWAMPETAIGFCPDIGASFFLSRMPAPHASFSMDPCVGLYIGMTGARLRAADMLWTGLATHFVPSAQLPQLIVRTLAVSLGFCVCLFALLVATGLVH